MKRMIQSGNYEKSSMQNLTLINMEESLDWLVEILQRDFSADISRIFVKEKMSPQEIFMEMKLENLSFGETILTTKFNESAVDLSKAHTDDAGIDLSSVIEISLLANERVALPTGWNMTPPDNHYFHVFGRSSLALKGIDVVGGVIDPGYTGEIKVIIVNNSGKIFEIRKGQRIAQAVPISIAKISGFIQNTKATNAMEIDDMDVAMRGASGFGSSNKGYND